MSGWSGVTPRVARAPLGDPDGEVAVERAARKEKAEAAAAAARARREWTAWLVEMVGDGADLNVNDVLVSRDGRTVNAVPKYALVEVLRALLGRCGWEPLSEPESFQRVKQGRPS